MLERIIRAVHRRLNPRARNALRTWLVLDARDRLPQTIDSYNERCVLVIAPHSDDEVLGCGGVIVRHVRGGGAVHAVFMTDGRLGSGELLSASLTSEERARRQVVLIDTRKREAREAAAVLGTHELHFLGLPDGRLCADRESVLALADVINSVRPDLIYLPFVYDLHEDHWQTNLVFSDAVRSLGGREQRSMRIRGYDVWTPLVANRIADISDVMPLKLQALSKFRSQLRDQDYLRTVEGLNVYRSGGVLGGNGHAEAFHELPLSAYLRLVQAAMLQSQWQRDSEIGAGRGALR